jgi:hypothetical protein
MASKYEELVEQGQIRRGRAPGAVSGSDQNEAQRKERNRRNAEAHRRALQVLKINHLDEFTSILADERSALEEGA